MRIVVLSSAFAFASVIAFAQQPDEAAPRAAVAAQPQTETDIAQPPPDPQHTALRIVGSHVRNPGGDKLGRIEEVLLNRTTRAIDYAVLAPNFPTNQSRLVPVPWSILTYAWDQSRAGGPAGANQIFIANLEPATLMKAPTLDRARTTGSDPALAAANSYFGVGTGGTGNSSGTVGGRGSSQPVLIPPVPAGATVVPQSAVSDGAAALPKQQQPVFVSPGGVPGFVFFDTNTASFSTNAGTTNVAGTPIPPATNAGTRVPLPAGGGRPFTPFPGGTNSQPQVNPRPNDQPGPDGSGAQTGDNSAGNTPPRGVAPSRTRGTPATPPRTAPPSPTR